MDLHTYQGEIEAFARYPQTHGLQYCRLGLFGEAGEIANQVKKILRDDAGELTPERRPKLIDELGDVLWYAVRYAHHKGIIVGQLTITIGADVEVVDIFTATEQLAMLVGVIMTLGDDAEEEDLVNLLNAIADVADYLDTTVEDVAQINVDKLTGRLERGTIGGSGDGR